MPTGAEVLHLIKALKSIEAASIDQCFPRNSDGSRLAVPAFYFGFYFPNGWQAEVRERVATICDDYWRLCGENLRGMTRPVSCSWQKIPPNYDMHAWRDELAHNVFKKFRPRRKAGETAREGLREAIAGSLPEEAELTRWIAGFPQQDWVWQMVFHSGRRRGEAAEYQILGCGDSIQTHGYSYLYLFLPISWFAAHPAQHPLALYQRWASVLQPRHGTAGIGLVPPEDETLKGQVAQAAQTVAGRYPGLELCDPLWQWGLARSGTLAPNWLTLIDDAYVETLGGHDRLQQAIDPTAARQAIGLHRYPGGLILSAGAVPALDGGEGMAAYRAVARALKPIRSTQPWGYWGAHRDHPLRWLARFD